MTTELTELQLKERELSLKQAEFRLKLRDAAIARWTNPLTIAVFAAAIAGIGNGYAIWRNGQLEERRAENARILELIKTGSIEQAAQNLKFLADTGLILDPQVRDQVRKYFESVGPGKGPALPTRVYTPVPIDYSSNNTIDYGTYTPEAPKSTKSKP